VTTPMNRDELKVRCEALAGVGDTAAAATLDVLARNDCLEEKNKLLAEANLKLSNENASFKWEGKEPMGPEVRKRLEALEYIYTKLCGTMTLAWELLTNDPVQGVAAAATPPKSVVEDHGYGKFGVTGVVGPSSPSGIPGGPQLTPEDVARGTVMEFVGVLHNGRPIGDAAPQEAARVPRPQPSAERGRSTGVGSEAPSVEEARAVASLSKEFGISDHEARAVVGSRKNMGLPVAVDPAVTQVAPVAAAGSYDKAAKTDAAP
jgi:hypothetical protein